MPDMPVRIIGGVRSVEIALLLCSDTAPMLLLKPVLSAPPTEWMLLAVDPILGW